MPRLGRPRLNTLQLLDGTHDPPPCPPPPATSSNSIEQQLAGLLVQFEVLSEAWPKAPRAVDRVSIGREHSQALDKIGSLQRRISVSRAMLLADAAVQLRRLEAIVDTGAMVSID